MWEDNIQERTGLISSLLRGQQKHIKIAGAVEKTSVMLQPQHGYGVEEEVLLLPHCSINDHISSVLLRSNLIIPWVITLGSQLQSGRPTKDHYYYMFYYNPCEHIQEEICVSGLTDRSVSVDHSLCSVAVGGMTQQVLPEAPAAPSDCQYKQACTRYLDQLGLEGNRSIST